MPTDPVSAGAPMTTPNARPPLRVSGRTWLFRALAVAGIPALLLFSLEGGLRVAIIYGERHDDPNAIRFLTAAERSGPVNSGVEPHRARKYFGLHQHDEARAYLAEARRISWYGGDPAVTQSIEGIMAKVQTQRP
jgi:hypothetical protein